MAPPGRRCQNGGLEWWFLREPRDWVVRRQRNQIARGAGLLQGSTLLPGQRRCRSPALRAIGLRGWTVSRGVWQQGRVLFFGRRNGPVQQRKRLAAEGIPAHPWPPWPGRGRAAGFFFKKRAKGSDRRFR